MPDYKLGWRKGPERPEKWRYRLVPPTTPDYTKPRSLAKYATVLFDQGAIGSCTANAGCLAAMMVAAIGGAPVPVLSRMWKYYQERQEIHTFPEDSGADIVDEYDTDKAPGEIADSVWPYDANPSETPPAATQTAQVFHPIAGWQPIAASDFRDGILTALDNNQPVSIGLNVWNGWETDWDQIGIWNQAGMNGGIAGGHAVLIIGWVPPNAEFPQGGYLFQNSWNATSPDNTKIHPDCTSGRGILDAATFALSQVSGEANAVVGANQPAILSLAVTGPKSVQVGAASAFSAALTGLPADSVVGYTWDFGDGTPAATASATASHTYSAAGSYTVTCTASVQTTGAKASATLAVSVAAPQPPQPGPAPSCLTEVDAAYTQQISAAQAAAKAGDQLVTVGWNSACAYVLAWSKTQTDTDLSSGMAGARVPKLPPPPTLPGAVTAATVTSASGTFVAHDPSLHVVLDTDRGTMRVP